MSSPRRKPSAKTQDGPCPQCGSLERHRSSSGKIRCQVCRLASATRYNRKRRNDPIFELFHGAKRRAKQKGITFAITVDDVRAAWPRDDKCPVLGIPLERGTGGKPQDSSPTLDRMNSAWGYEKDNICVISFRANSAKRAMRASELEAVAAWMRSRGLD